MVSAAELAVAREAVQSASPEQLQVLQADRENCRQRVQPEQIALRASTRIFSTTEIIKHILLHLDAVQLLTVQRMDRNFCNNITGSSKLQ